MYSIFRVQIWRRSTWILGAYWAHLLCKKEEATTTSWKVFDEASSFTIDILVDVLSFMTRGQPLSAILYTTVLTAFGSLRASNVLLSPFDVVFTAAKVSFSYMTFTKYAVLWRCIIGIVSNPPAFRTQGTIFHLAFFTVFTKSEDVT